MHILYYAKPFLGSSMTSWGWQGYASDQCKTTWLTNTVWSHGPEVEPTSFQIWPNSRGKPNWIDTSKAEGFRPILAREFDEFFCFYLPLGKVDFT